MSTALYRRYRPETFADVIGQEHVTEPLMAAIDKDRINHAYLFSGPRGCGKTTSARILARCLNCAQGPTSTPCGVCDSCVELARNGSGSLDVIEIDAASHGGVDDARDLRERATFAPVRDRFKIFIIDEAHMVTSAGFNALLKIVEEPPEHILFIFATTEPDKVIGTIRSRTHHYPFRLVPPEPLMAYLELLCRQENVPVAPGVLSLVIRAGGGSVRDSLSVLDQLMAGAGENGLDYELAVSLLGYTHATLLDDVVESMAAGDAGTVFNAVDRVIQTGHDPRRFVEDLLERFRDLIVINAVPEGAASILRGVPDDQLNRMRTQATQLGAGELSRAADVTNTALTEMTGATSPRLHLELLCARLLLPAADATARGTLARVDRIERRLEYAGGAPAAAPSADQPVEPADSVEAPKTPARPRLDVPRNAEEAAARWSLPSAEQAAPAVPAAVPGAHAPAIPAAVRSDRPAADSGSADSSPDWGGSWGVSTDTAFDDADSTTTTAEASSSGPAATAPSGPAAQRAQGSSDSAVSTDSPAAAAAGSRPGTVNPGTPDAPGGGGPDAEVPIAGSPAGAPREQAPTGHEGEAAGQPGQGVARETEQRRPATAGSVDAQRGTAAPTGGSHPPVAARLDAGRREDAGSARSGSVPRQPAPQGGQDAGKPQPDGGRQGQSPASGGGNVEMVRRAWPEIMDEVAKIKRATWLIVNVSAKPRSFDGNQLVLAFANQGNAIGFQRGPHMDNLKQAIHKVLGLTCSIEAVHDVGGAGESGPKVPAGRTGPGGNPGPDSPAPLAGATTPAGPTADGPAGAPPHAQPVREQADVARASAADSSASTLSVDPGPRENAGESQPGDARSEGGRTPTPVVDPADRAPAPDASPAGAEQRTSPPQSPVAEPGALSAANRPSPAAALSGPGQAGDAPASSGSTSSGPGQFGGAPASSAPASRAPAASGSPAARTAEATVRPAATASSGTEPAASSGLNQSEAVSAWDPSMSDDSWAMVEPPEEAFDPGPDLESVPDDPYERRSSAPRTGPAARPGRATPSPGGASTGARAPGAQETGTTAANSSAPARTQPTASAPVAAAPSASRSVVWSPPAEEQTKDTGQSPPVPAASQHGTPTTAAQSAGTTDGAARQSAGERPAGPVIPSFVRAAEQVAQKPAAVAPVEDQSGTTAARDSGRGAADRSAPTSGDAWTTGGTAPSAPGVTGAPDGADRPAAAGNVRQKPVSRYQQLLDEAERKRAEEAAAMRGTADLRFVEDEPSADDETIEESGLVGRTAIERILNGRLIEERSSDGH